jgi:hypothetical protein
LTNFKNYGILIIEKRKRGQNEKEKPNGTTAYKLSKQNKFTKCLLDKLKKMCYNISIVKEKKDLYITNFDRSKRAES